LGEGNFAIAECLLTLRQSSMIKSSPSTAAVCFNVQVRSSQNGNATNEFTWDEQMLSPQDIKGRRSSKPTFATPERLAQSAFDSGNSELCLDKVNTKLSH